MVLIIAYSPDSAVAAIMDMVAIYQENSLYLMKITKVSDRPFLRLANWTCAFSLWNRRGVSNRHAPLEAKSRNGQFSHITSLLPIRRDFIMIHIYLIWIISNVMPKYF